MHGTQSPAIGAAAAPAFDFDQQQPAGFLDQQIDFAPPAAPIANHQLPTLLLQEPQGPLLRPASLQGRGTALGFGTLKFGIDARGAHGKTRRPFTSAPGVPFLGLLQQESSHA